MGSTLVALEIQKEKKGKRSQTDWGSAASWLEAAVGDPLRPGRLFSLAHSNIHNPGLNVILGTIMGL